MANKAQLIARLSANTGVSSTNVEAVVNALPDTLGEWMRQDGNNNNGTYSGEIEDVLAFGMTRASTPAPGHWNLEISTNGDFLDTFGDGSNRFGLPVENA